MGNTAVISYNTDGRIASITNPSAPNGGAYNKNAQAKHIYSYTNGNLTGIAYTNGRSASYTYDARRNLTQMKDHAGYRVDYAYSSKNRVIQVAETGSRGAAGQKYTITYNSDNTNSFRFSGANDRYGDNDDVINTYVFDEKGKTLSEYSVLAGATETVIGATAVTYGGDEQDGTDTANNKIKDSAVVGKTTLQTTALSLRTPHGASTPKKERQSQAQPAQGAAQSGISGSTPPILTRQKCRMPPQG